MFHHLLALDKYKSNAHNCPASLDLFNSLHAFAVIHLQVVLHSPSLHVSPPTMSAPTAPSAFGKMAFVPRDLVRSQYSASVSPKVESSMPVYKRAHAFQVARTALGPLPVDMRLILDALGTQLNCSAIVDGLIFD